ncbi:hypothetical protein AAG906_030640 [Vitis piasezkii]
MLLPFRRTHLFRTLAHTAALPSSPAATVAAISPSHQRRYHAPPPSISTASLHHASQLLREHHHAPLLRRHTTTSIILRSAAPQATHPPSPLLHRPCPHCCSSPCRQLTSSRICRPFTKSSVLPPRETIIPRLTTSHETKLPVYTTAPLSMGSSPPQCQEVKGRRTMATYQPLEDKVAGESQTRGKPIRCRAAVSRKAGEPLVMEEVMVAPPMAGEVRIRIICTSLCHSDLTFWKLKEPPACFPRILGHEAVGVVESVGENVTEVAEGDTVLPIFIPDCGECMDCRSEKSNLCSKFPFEISPWLPRHKSSRFTDLKGEVLYHFLNVSSFSEYTVVDIDNITKISPAIPPNKACLFSCGVSTGVGAAWRTANVEKGSTVVIFGLGAIGLAVAEGARLCGASRIIGVDTNLEKFDVAKKFGVTEFVNPRNCGDKPVSQAIVEMTDGGADYCFECVGFASLVQDAFASCRKGWGKAIMVGVDKPGAMLNFSSVEMLHCGKSVMGSIYGGLKPKSHIPVLLQRLVDKELNVDNFITHEMKFEDINKAFDLLAKGKSIRCVMWMDK